MAMVDAETGIVPMDGARPFKERERGGGEERGVGGGGEEWGEGWGEGWGGFWRAVDGPGRVDGEEVRRGGSEKS